MYLSIPQDQICNALYRITREISLCFPSNSKAVLAAYRCNYASRLSMDLEALVFFYPHVSFCVDWDDLMAKNKPAFNLIDYRLSETELDAFEKWVEKTKPTPLGCLSGLAQRDYKISLTFVENSEAWCVSVTGKEDAKFNSASTLTTWSDDPMEGIVMAYYKVSEVFEGGVWKTKNQSRRG